MTLTELKYLVALSETKHFGAAAKRCHVSQPTLSVAIKKLESLLNIVIFERKRDEIRITEIGEKIIAQAKRVLMEADNLGAIAKNEKSHLQSPLKIGAIYTVAPYLFPALIPKIKKYAPDMPLIIQENFTNHLREKLESGELDAIFVALPFKTAGLVRKVLYDEPFVVLMRKDHPLSKKKNIMDSDLKEEQILLLGKNNCFRDQVIKACARCYSTNNETQNIEGASLETLRHMVASGTGITILPSSATAIHYYNHILCVKPFKNNIPQRTIVLVWRNGFPRTKAIDAIIQAFNDCALEGVSVNR